VANARKLFEVIDAAVGPARNPREPEREMRAAIVTVSQTKNTDR
jgi:hypothetical protein